MSVKTAKAFVLKGCNRMMSILAIGEVVEDFEITPSFTPHFPATNPATGTPELVLGALLQFGAGTTSPQPVLTCSDTGAMVSVETRLQK